jgi:secreted trypsin-like serine protease
MARQPFGWHALAIAAGLGTAGVGIDSAGAQSLVPGSADADGLVYQRQLDLSLNPTRVAEAAPSVADTQDEVFVERSLQALVPEYDGGGRSRTRVVHGIQSNAGEWPTAVSLDILKEGARSGSLCAGTVIDSRWILTAAHCVFSRRTGGVNGLRAVTAFAKSNVPHSGEARRVKSVVVHPQFRPVPRPGKGAGLINDIALLELETSTSAPRQKLAALSGQSAFLAPGTMMTVIGWGLTKPRRPDEDQDPKHLSKVLLKADVPVPQRSACETFLAFTGAPGDSVFCAGDGKGGADSCNGDSGGPIFATGPAGEPVQTGVVSWGDGCALPGSYGAYATIPHFQQWIAKYVPKAQWVAPRDLNPSLDTIAAAKPGSPPARHGQVTADIRVHGCEGTTALVVPPNASGAANKVKVGSCLTVQVTSGAGGHLAVFNRDAEGVTRQIFPNQRSRGTLPGQAKTRVRAGQVVTIPGPADGFQFEIRNEAPRGRNEVIAIVVPEGADLPEITKQFEDMRAIDRFDEVLGRIAAKTRRIDVTPRTSRAVGTRQFDIVD